MDSCPLSDVRFIDLSDTDVLDTGWNACASDYEPQWVPYQEVYPQVCGSQQVCNWNSSCTDSSKISYCIH